MPWFIPLIMSAVSSVAGTVGQTVGQAGAANDIIKKQKEEEEYKQLLVNEERQRNYNQQLYNNQKLVDDYKYSMTMNTQSPSDIYGDSQSILARYGGCFPNRNGNNKMYSRNTILNNSRNYYTRIAAGI